MGTYLKPWPGNEVGAFFGVHFMGLLKPAMNQTAYLKLGLLGFEGSGKTYLACQFAIGLCKLQGKKKVAFFDTEKGSDFWVKKFAEADIQLDQLRSRSFADLLTVIKEAEQGDYGFLIIDSITHVWRELCDSYLKRKNKERISMPDWVALKSVWSQFTSLYVNSKVHIAMCGRAGHEYDLDEDENGKKEIIKTGTKMKAEGETGFEPDLLIETYKVALSEMLTDRKAKKNAKGFINRCCVIKDRSDLLNGKVIDKPKFEHFLPVIQVLNLGGAHSGPQANQNSEALFSDNNRSYAEMQKNREIALEEIKGILVMHSMDGNSAEAKKGRAFFMQQIFGTASWTAIEGLSLSKLNTGVHAMKQKLQPKELLGSETESSDSTHTQAIGKEVAPDPEWERAVDETPEPREVMKQ